MFGPQRPYLAEGHAADSPGNTSGARVFDPPAGPIAQSVATHGVARTQVYPVQATAPSPQPQALLATTTADTASASSISSNGGTALVVQLELRTPTGVVPSLTAVPAQPPFHTAPTGATAFGARP